MFHHLSVDQRIFPVFETHLNHIHQDDQVVVFEIHRVAGSHHVGHGLDDDVPVELVIAPHGGLNGVLEFTPDQSCPDQNNACHAGSYLLRWTARMEMWLENFLRESFKVYAECLLDLGHWGQPLNISAALLLWVSFCFRAQAMNQWHGIYRLIEPHKCHCQESAQIHADRETRRRPHRKGYQTGAFQRDVVFPCWASSLPVLFESEPQYRRRLHLHLHPLLLMDLQRLQGSGLL